MPNARDIELRQLRILLALVEHGSISRAAVSLRLAQSTVSESIASLDRALGTPVIAHRRGGHRLHLTAAGTALVPHARNVLRELHAARRDVSAAVSQARSTVDVLTVESLSTYLLPRALAATRRRWTNTRFAVSVAPCSTIRASIARGDGDIGVLLEESRPLHAARGPAGSELIVIARDIPLIVFCAPGNVLAAYPRRSVTLDTLTPLTVFVSDSAGEYHDMLVRYVSPGGIPGPRLEASGSVEATRLAVLADESAIGILPVYAVASELRARRLRALPVEPSPPTMRISAYLPMAGAHPAARALVEWLCEATVPITRPPVSATA